MRQILPAPASGAFRPRNGLLVLLAACCTLGLGGCVYRMNVQQGNYIDAKQVDQVETGMTRSQVMFVLGTPMIPNGFDADRWDYYYSPKTGRIGDLQTRRVTVLFENDRVKSVERGPGVEPEAPAATQAEPVASAAAAPATTTP